MSDKARHRNPCATGGVSPKDHQAIFEKFAKARDRNTGRPSGSGLGLTISRHIVEHHNGRIRVQPRRHLQRLLPAARPAKEPPPSAVPVPVGAK